MKLSHSFLPISALLFLTFSPVLFAGTVNQSNVTSFQDGTTAVAAQVNANFQALITAINDNAARITALEASSGDAITSTSLAGTWDLFEVSIDVDQTSAGNFSIAGKSVSGTFTLNANGSGSFSTSESYRQLRLSSMQVQVRNSSNSGATTVDTATVQMSTPVSSETGNFNWTLANGKVTITPSDGSAASFAVASNKLMISGINDSEGKNGLVIVVRR